MSQLSFDDFLKRVREADNRLLDELERILTISALSMEREAKLNATSYPKVRTGRLRSSITGLIDAPMGSPRVVLRAGDLLQVVMSIMRTLLNLVLGLFVLVFFLAGLYLQKESVCLIGYLLFLMLVWDDL